MKRSTYFLVSGILGLLFGAMMLLAPDKASQGFGFMPLPSIFLMFRSLGALVIGAGSLNLLVRDHKDSPTLKSVLAFNMITHALGMAMDLWAVSDHVVGFDKLVPAQVVHLIVGLGAFIYWKKMR
jgi:hypothetical protein